MDKNNAKDFLPLVDALASGKTIQIKLDDGLGWVDMPDVMFGRDVSDYRIKPESKNGWYRVALFKHDGEYMTYLLDSTSYNDAERDWEKDEYFIKWLSDKIEYEISEEVV